MLIIASDGLWDVVNERDIETFSKIYWSKKGMRSTYSYTVELLAEAIKKGTKDNISVMALAFYDLE
jgi:serine/threonine protein phosphatase PrpC